MDTTTAAATTAPELVEATMTDCRVTLNGGVVHRAEITLYTTPAGKLVERRISIACGARRVRSSARSRQDLVVAPLGTPVECKRCANH